ncbi:hypothetical protein [Persicitalea jodogahamensis]|nr:hypothetical protein [Persicitalea jodogahamensis]
MTKKLPLLISALIFAAFFLTVHHFVVNIPSRDDFAATLSFIQMQCVSDVGIFDQITALFIPHNEHYIVLSRLSAALAYNFAGHLNFTALVWYQNIFLLGGYALVLQIIRQQKLPLLVLLLPTTIFFFNLSFWQVTLYYWGGIQYYTVFFFAILSLYFLHVSLNSGSAWFAGGIVAATLAVLSFGNGIVVLPAGFLLLWGQRQRKRLLVWTGFSAIVIMLFWLNFQGPSTVRPAFNPVWMGKLLFTFLGSFLYVNPSVKLWSYANIVLCAVVGLGVLFVWVRLLVNGYLHKNPLLYSLLTLTLLTALLIAFGRFETKAAGGIAPRYMYFSTLIPVFLVLIYADLQKRQNKNLPVKALASSMLLIWGLSYANNIQAIEAFNQENLSTFHQWEQDHRRPLVPPQNHDPRYSEVLLWAMENNVYTPPVRLLATGDEDNK